MPRADDTHRSELLQRIEDSARWRLGDEAAAPLIPFLRSYWARVPLDDIEGRTADGLFGAAFAHWRLAEYRACGDTAGPRLQPDARRARMALRAYGCRGGNG